MELTPKQDLKLQFGGEYSLEFLLSTKQPKVMRLARAPKLYQSMDLNACAKPALLWFSVADLRICWVFGAAS
jgi:hypothetical protein